MSLGCSTFRYNKNREILNLYSYCVVHCIFEIFIAKEQTRCNSLLILTSNKNIHFEMILDVGFGEKRKETRF